MDDWFVAAGLNRRPPLRLAKPLTVVLWSGEKPRRRHPMMTCKEPPVNLPIADAPTKPVAVSFEFFPPKTEKMQETLWECVKRLEPLAPSFVSVTYGAGGSTRERTHDTVVRIARETTLKPADHLTCVGHVQGEVDDIARRYWDEGIRHIVALRGDAPEGSGAYQPTAGGYAYAADLVAGLGASPISRSRWPPTRKCTPTPPAPSSTWTT